MHRPSLRPQHAFVLVAVALALVSGCGTGVVKLPDCIDCRPVEMTIDQVFEVELGSDRAITNDPDAFVWIAVDTGSMDLLEEKVGTRPEDENEFIGGYSRAQTFTLRPTEVGTTTVRFDLVPADGDGAAPVQSLETEVVVSN